MNRVYFDNAATTPIDPKVIEAMTKAMQEQHGNPSSIHADGRAARTLLEQSRKTIAQALNASIGEIFFTSGGTEANNMALKCAVRDLGVTRIISSPTEHHCVLHSLDSIAQHNEKVSVVKLELDDKGLADMSQLKTLLQDNQHNTLVTLMHANNEIGTMIDLERVGELCAEAGAYFHTDTVQTMGFYPIDVDKIKVSFLSGAGHKFYGPKGVGFIYINSDNIIGPFVDGGSQERNMRGGTENTYGIVGMATALDLMLTNREDYEKHIRHLRAILLEKIGKELPMVGFNGDVDNGHYKTLNLRLPANDKTNLILFSLDIAGISVSGGSACSSGTDTGSHVIRALDGGASDAVNVRVSFSHNNTEEEVVRLVEELRRILLK